MATVSGYSRELKRVINVVGLRVFGRRMGNDDYISISCGPRCVGQLEAEPLVGVKDRWIYRFVPEGTPDLPFAGSRRRSGHLAAGNCLVQKSLDIIGKTRFGVSSSPTYLLPILLSPSFNGWLRFIQIRSSAARRNISKVCSPTLNDTIRPAWMGTEVAVYSDFEGQRGITLGFSSFLRTRTLGLPPGNLP